MSAAFASALATTWLWNLMLACLVALALLWWIVRGAQRWRRQRSLRQALARVQQADPGTGAPPTTSALDAAFGAARQALQQAAPPGRRRAALYQRPWVLFLGESDNRVGDLLHAAAAPDAPDASGAPRLYGSLPDSFWRWHLLPDLVAIEVDPRLVELPAEPPDLPAARRLLGCWFHALLLLARCRGALPLDALVLCIDAQQLLRGAQATTELAARLRLRADEASQHLRLRLPTQVLVTGLDRLPGYASVREMLPEPMPAQAVGIRVPPGALLVIDEVLDDLGLRLRALRMGLLQQQPDQPPDAARQLAVHRFFGQWLALQAGVSLALRRIFAASSAAPYRLRGRGLYYVAAPDVSTPAQPAFVADLFSRFLPAERAFARLRR